MSYRQRPALPGREPATVCSCWMCGIRLPAEQMVPDGGSACPDLRWYCRDTRACTRRWTSLRGRLAGSCQDPAGTLKALGEQTPPTAADETPTAPGEQAVGADTAEPVPA